MRQQRMFISADIQSDGNVIGLLKKKKQQQRELICLYISENSMRTWEKMRENKLYYYHSRLASLLNTKILLEISRHEE